MNNNSNFDEFPDIEIGYAGLLLEQIRTCQAAITSGNTFLVANSVIAFEATLSPYLPDGYESVVKKMAEDSDLLLYNTHPAKRNAYRRNEVSSHYFIGLYRYLMQIAKQKGLLPQETARNDLPSTSRVDVTKFK